MHTVQILFVAKTHKVVADLRIILAMTGRGCKLYWSQTKIVSGNSCGIDIGDPAAT